MAFVAPPNRDVGIEGRELTLSPAAPDSIAPSVDRLLSSAAVAFGPGVIAVILSGSGSDGAAGAAAVKRAGGAVLVENPASAQFGSMPAAVPVDLVDAVVDIAEMGQAVISLIGNGVQGAAGGAETRGRQRANGHKRPTDAGFFRDRTLFAHLATAVWPELIARAAREGADLRVWLVGCSTGEDAYSLCISALEAIERSGHAVTARIFATDENAEAIATARRGRYPATSLGRMSRAQRARYLVAAKGGYEIDRALRADARVRAARPSPAGSLPADRPGPVSERSQPVAGTAPAGGPRGPGVLAAGWRAPGPGPADTADELAEAFVEESRRPLIYQRTGRPTRLPLMSRASLAALRSQRRAGDEAAPAGRRTDGWWRVFPPPTRRWPRTCWRH